MIDSCAQTEVSTQSTSTADQTPGDTDAIDGIHPLHHGVLNEHTKSIYTSEEDVAVIVEPASLNIPLSQEVNHIENLKYKLHLFEPKFTIFLFLFIVCRKQIQLRCRWLPMIVNPMNFDH